MIRHPISFALTQNKDIIVHTVDITHDLAEAKSSFLDRNYTHAGVKLGHIAYAVYPYAENKRDVAEAAQEVKPGPKNVPFLYTSDGRTIRFPDPAVRVHDSV